ncbi:MAG: sirohydrochlorin chelatase [Emcibacter sp.]|nr:sirohydrochlorin chelatase [Emcibacter sp.]
MTGPLSPVKAAATGVLLCGHGSRSPKAAKEFNDLAENIRREIPDQPVRAAFLEFNAPDILEGLRAFYDQGITEIIVQPVTLYNAGHTIRDIPKIISKFAESHPDVRLHYGSFLGLSPAVIEAAASAILSVMPKGQAQDSKLLLVGRGSKDRLITDQTINLCRALHERLDLGDSRYCYNFSNAPLLPTALTQAAASHYKHVIILPCLLFSGRLLSDIHAEIDIAAKKYPEFSFHKAPPLGGQSLIIKAIIKNINAAAMS